MNPKPPPNPGPEIVETLTGLFQTVTSFASGVFEIARAEFDKRYQWLIGGRRVLVLGEPASGKTALRYLLQTGAPGPRDANGVIGRPSKTTGVVDGRGLPSQPGLPLAEIVMGLVAPPGMVRSEGGSVMFLPRDVAGELHDKWTLLVRELHPEVVIYMVDGRASKDAPFIEDGQRAPSFTEVAQNLVATTFDLLAGADLAPKAIGVFIGFSDQWNPEADPFEDMLRRRAIEDAFLVAARAKYADHKKLLGRMQYFSIQLSPEKTAWPEVEAAFRALVAQA